MKSFISIATDSRESLLRRNNELAQQLAKARQEISELKAIVRNYRRSVAIPGDSLRALDTRSLDTLGRKKEVSNLPTKTISPTNDKENIAINKNIMAISVGKKVSPEIDIAMDSGKKARKRSSEKKERKQSPEHEESIERLSNNSFSPVNIDIHSVLEKVEKENVKKEKKRRMSYSGNDNQKLQMNTEKLDDIEEAFDFLSNVQKSNTTVVKRRSSMSSLPTSRDDNYRMSLSPSRRPLRFRSNSVDYKEASLKQKMRSSFYTKNKEK